jgi:hypothetical protein
MVMGLNVQGDEDDDEAPYASNDAARRTRIRCLHRETTASERQVQGGVRRRIDLQVGALIHRSHKLHSPRRPAVITLSTPHRLSFSTPRTPEERTYSMIVVLRFADELGQADPERYCIDRIPS